MEAPYLHDNPHLGEHPLAFNLSARLPCDSGTSKFHLDSGETLDIRGALAGSFPGVSLELIHDIFQQLDLASLARLGATSTGMKRLVSSLPKLRTLLHCAPDAMRAVYAARAGHKLICSDMHAKLLKPNCDQCGQPGELLHIFQCERLCHHCLTTHGRYRALRPRQAAAQYALRPQDVHRLPGLRVPRYSAETVRERRQNRSKITPQVNTTGWKLIDPEDVFRLSFETHGSVGQAKREGSARLSSLLQIHGGYRSNEEWIYSGLAHRFGGTRRDAGWLYKGRFAAHLLPGVESALSVSTLFPWYDVDTSYYGLPVVCEACIADGLPSRECYYCAAGCDEHMARRGEIIDGTHVKNT